MLHFYLSLVYNLNSMRRTILLLFLLLCPLAIRAQRCVLLSVRDGLSSNTINSIYQDKSGDVWIATENGLNRYDGLSIHIYKNNPADPHSISHNIIRAITEDAQGRLLVAGQSGVQYYDRRTDSFSEPIENESGIPYTGAFNYILSYDENSVWLSGNDLLTLDSGDGKKPVLKELRLPIPTRRIGMLQKDADGTVWCGRYGDGIYKLDPDGGSSHYLLRNLTDLYVIVSNSVNGIVYAADRDGNVCHFNPETDEFEEDPSPGMEGIRITRILNTGDGRVLFCTDENGVRVLNTATGEWSLLKPETIPSDPATMTVRDIIKDRDGNLWLAAYQCGVIVIPAEDVVFHYLGSRSIVSDVIGSKPVSSLLSEEDGKLWVGTQGDGLYLLDSDLSLLKHYGVEEGFPNTIFDVTRGHDGYLWFGSYGYGLWRLDTKRGQLVNTVSLNENDYPASTPRSICPDDSGRLWLTGTGEHGFYCYDPVQRRTIRPEIQGETIDNLVSDILVRGNDLYLATSDGLYHLDISEPALSVQNHFLPGVQVYCLASDSRNIYACTIKGLAILDSSTYEISMVTKEDGLPDNTILNVQIGEDGELWLSTGTCLVRYNPASRTIGFSEDDLLVEEFLEKVSATSPDGRIFFGGIGGITYFKPSEIRPPSRPMKVKIVSVSVPDKTITQNDDGLYVLPHSIRTCRVSFTTADILNQYNVQYSYSLDGKNWNALDRGQTSVTFGDIAPGRYHFSVKAVTGDSFDEPATISIRVLSPWWSSPLAICLYSILALLLIGFIAYLVRHDYNSRKEIARYEREQNAKEEKLRFFMSLSHEIRSPMTLVKAPLQKLIETDPDPERQRNYSVIERSADNVLSILDQTLNISKAEEGAMKLSFAPVKLVPYISSILDLFRPQAEHNRQRLAFRYACSGDLEVWLDRNYFNKVIANLLSNALKYTPSGGNIQVTVSAGSEMARIEVKDSGSGIDDQALHHIFDLFYQSSDAVSGTGIGLYFAKTITDLHHGSISVANNPDGEGSVFTVTLPLGNAHLNDEQIASPDSKKNNKAGLDIPQVVLPEAQKDDKGYKKHSILIVEDNSEIRHWLATELSATYRVMEAENGKQAYSMALSAHPNLIVSDVIMPGMDGFELCSKIRKNPNTSSLPVILLTARTMDRDKIQGIEAGADAYITKPFNIEVLKTTLDNLLKGRERLKVTLAEPKVDEKDIRDIGIKAPDDRLLERIVRIINEHIGDPDLTVEQVAAMTGISRVHLHRKLKELTGQTSRDFIRNLRLKKAAEMLSEKKYAISELADAVGFHSASSFTTSFKELFGVSPTEYVQQNKEL